MCKLKNILVKVSDIDINSKILSKKFFKFTNEEVFMTKL